tara:strand:+ start:486 stop:1004 length:519 start_codon:yes stop_codon:yes gene_type:complete
MLFNFLKNDDKLHSSTNSENDIFYENLNDDQKNNYQLLTILSVIYGLISSDEEVSNEELIVYNKLEKEIKSKIIPDLGLSKDKTIQNLNLQIKKNKNIGKVLRNLPKKELDFFWENLISFAMVDEYLMNEEVNFIREIVLKIFPEMKDVEARKYVNSLLRKHLGSERFGFED